MMTIKQTVKRSKKQGNSLSFLLVSLSVLSISLSITSVMMGPLFTKEAQSKASVEQAKIVADRHLDQIEKHIRANPSIFVDPRPDSPNWSAIKTTGPDNIPPFQNLIIRTGLYNYYWWNNVPGNMPSALLTYTENIALHDALGTPTLTVTSTLPDDSLNNRYGIIRFAEPYKNTFRLMVDAQVGTTKVTRRRLITLTAKTCDVTNAPWPMDFVIPYQAGEDLDTGAGVAVDYRLAKVSGPFVQIGSQRVCKLPDYNDDLTTPKTFSILSASAGEYTPKTYGLTCDYVASGIELLDGMQDSVTVGTTPTLVHNKFTFLRGTAEIRLDYTRGGTINSALSKPMPAPEGMTASDIAVHTFRPFTGDPNNTYQAAVFLYYPSSKKMYMNTAKWDNTIGPQGIFANNPNHTDLWPALSTIETFTYHKPTRMIVVTENTDATNRRIRVQKLGYPNSGNNPPTIDGNGFGTGISEITSTTPTATNQASTLQAASLLFTFGKPVVSRAGDFIVVPFLRDSSEVTIMAFSTKDIQIDSKNCSVGCTAPASEKSNIAPLMTFKLATNTTINSTNDTQGVTLTNLNDIHIWFNDKTNKFYWVTRNNPPSDQLLYEWDPNTWGIGDGAALSTTAQWVANGKNVVSGRKNITVAGQKSDTTACAYTGTYRTVRKIGYGNPSATGGTCGFGGVSMWAASGGDNAYALGACGITLTGSDSPSMLYDEQYDAMYIRTSTGIFRLNLSQPNANPRLVTALPPPAGSRGMTIDPRTGWLYVSSGKNSATSAYEQGVFGYNQNSFKYTAYPNTTDTEYLNQIIGAPDFSDNTGHPSLTYGDGDMYFSVPMDTLYFIDVPPTYDPALNTTANRPKLYAYKPSCYSSGAANASSLGYTTKGHTWMNTTEEF